MRLEFELRLVRAKVNVLRLVLGDGMKLALSGAAIGIACSIGTKVVTVRRITTIGFSIMEALIKSAFALAETAGVARTLFRGIVEPVWRHFQEARATGARWAT
jgi:hypothetical protein